MADGVTLLLLVLATYRVATDLAWEAGPFGCYAQLRGAVIQRLGGEHWASEGITCPICLSFWLAPAVIVLYRWSPLLVWWLAVAGAAALLARWPRGV